jgi:hygromycin-B 7''-O-kinase
VDGVNGDGFTLTADLATDLLRDLIPGAKVAGVERSSGGQISGAYEVRFADGEDPVIVKVYAPDAEDKLVKEEHVYGLLHRHGVGARPRLLGGAAEGRSLGRPYLVMTKLAGRSLESIKDQLTRDELAEIYRQLGAILADVHRVERDAFGYIYRDGIYNPQPTNSAYMTALAAEKLAEFEVRGGDSRLRRSAQDFIAERTELLTRCVVPRLVHNDFHEGNVLIDRGPSGAIGRSTPVVTGFIDVENAIAGDPLADIAKTYGYDIAGRPHEDAKIAGFEAGYGGFPADWRGTAALYRLVHSFELWVFFHGIGEARWLDSVADEMWALISAG